MKKTFQSIRMLFILLPLASWTIIWPILYLVSYTIIVFLLLLNTVFYVVGLPFSVLKAALSSNLKWHKEYFDEWKDSYSKTINFTNNLSIEKTYREIIDWGNGANNITHQIVFTNIIFLMLLFEETRTYTFFIIGLIVAFFVWASSL
jgi:hypothetical protein